MVTAWRVPAGDKPGDNLLLNKIPFKTAYEAFHGRPPSPLDVVANSTPAASRWHYYCDDVLPHLPEPVQQPAPWISSTVPGFKAFLLTPGILVPYAAAIHVPVLVAAGERDVIADINAEASAYASSPAVDLYSCPAMGHMHNFAGTRQQLWQRLQHWGEWVGQYRTID